MMMANMMMQTCRKTIRANILAASRQGLFLIPLIIILPHGFGLLGVEICQAVSDLIFLVCDYSHRVDCLQRDEMNKRLVA